MSGRVSAGVALVVEDDRSFRLDLLDVLHEAGYPSIGAPNGADAADYLSSGAPVPAVILLDLEMDRMSGPEFVRWVRDNPRLREVPIVLISGHPDLARIGRDLGAAGVLCKPFKPEAVLAQVRYHCST